MNQVRAEAATFLNYFGVGVGGRGWRWAACLFENSRGGRDVCPVFQMACLSGCSVLTERSSGGSDVGGRLLSTPSRLLRHTGQVSCWERRENMVTHLKGECQNRSSLGWYSYPWSQDVGKYSNTSQTFKPLNQLTTGTPCPYQLQPRHYAMTVEVMEAGKLPDRFP